VKDRQSDIRTASQTLRRGLQLLEELARVGPIGLSPLTRRLELPKTVTFRLLKTLQEQGYVSQDPVTTRYQLTFRMLMIGSSIRQKIDLHQCAQPVLERLVTDTRETAHVGVLDDIYMIPIQKVESPEALRADVPMGRRVPAFCSALGKAILAFLPAADLQRVIANTEFISHTSTTIRTASALRQELSRIRTRGFAVNHEEFDRGIRSVGAPIFRRGHFPVAALSVSGPVSRLTRARADDIGEMVRRAAAVVSRDFDLKER
jgi:DNA-binding IclR family transcriptional regulator